MYRYVSLSALVLGAVAACSSEQPTGAGCAVMMTGPNGEPICVAESASSVGMGGPAASNTGTMPGGSAGPVADLGGGPVPDLGGPVPDLGGPVPDLGSPMPTSGTGPTPGATGPSNPGDPSPVATGPGPADTGGPTPVMTGGPSDPVMGPDPVAGNGGNGPVGTGGTPGIPASTMLATIVVDAGTLDRDHSVVSFSFPAGVGKQVVLKDAAGAELPLQMSPLGDDKATFILPSLGAGQQATYTVEELPAQPTATITAVEENSHLFVKTPASTIFRWTLIEDNFRNAASRDVRKGYIYPVYTPSGLNVADDYQVDHPHMHGIWSAWTSTTFRGHAVDFWNGYAQQGRVDLNSMEGKWSGTVHAGLVANLDHIDITTNPSVVALTERWIVTVYQTHADPAPYYIYDVDSVQNAATTDPLVLEQYHYGGFGYRGSEDWQTPSEVEFLTSEGHTRANGDGQNARWCAQYGNVDGQRAGYAAFDHPTNFRHPQGLRIHPTNPYWAFVPVTPLKGGRFSLEPGVPYHSLYRIVAFDGDANADVLNRLWDDFATPPTVTVQ